MVEGDMGGGGVMSPIDYSKLGRFMSHMHWQSQPKPELRVLQAESRTQKPLPEIVKKSAYKKAE
jgi:hypothetical protein